MGGVHDPRAAIQAPVRRGRRRALRRAPASIAVRMRMPSDRREISIVERELGRDGCSGRVAGRDRSGRGIRHPVPLRTRPPHCEIAVVRTSSWRANASRIASGSASHLTVEPSMSVKSTATSTGPGRSAEVRRCPSSLSPRHKFSRHYSCIVKKFASKRTLESRCVTRRCQA